MSTLTAVLLELESTADSFQLTSPQEEITHHSMKSELTLSLSFSVSVSLMSTLRTLKLFGPRFCHRV